MDNIIDISAETGTPLTFVSIGIVLFVLCTVLSTCAFTVIYSKYLTFPQHNWYKSNILFWYGIQFSRCNHIGTIFDLKIDWCGTNNAVWKINRRYVTRVYRIIWQLVIKMYFKGCQDQRWPEILLASVTDALVMTLGSSLLEFSWLPHESEMTSRRRVNTNSVISFFTTPPWWFSQKYGKLKQYKRATNNRQIQPPFGPILLNIQEYSIKNYKNHYLHITPFPNMQIITGFSSSRLLLPTYYTKWIFLLDMYSFEYEYLRLYF